MRNFIVLLSLVILTWCSPVFAKPQCTLTHYDEFNGLTQWWVTQIIQDRQGMIWISTWNGLNRYDGYEFVCFKSRAGDGVDIPSDRIDDIVLAEDGSLRCNIDNRVFGFCPQTCKYYELGKKEEARFVRMFKEKHKYELFLENSGAPQQFSDKNGTEWLVYRDGGLKYKDPFTRQYMSYQVDIFVCLIQKEMHGSLVAMACLNSLLKKKHFNCLSKKFLCRYVVSMLIRKIDIGLLRAMTPP